MVVPESSIANTHNSKKLMSPNFENTKARPDDTTLSIQKVHPPFCASTESSHSSFPSLMDDSPPSDCDYAERVATQNNMDIVADNAPHPMAPRSATLPCRLCKRHMPPTRTHLTNPPLLTTSICLWNPPCPWSFPIALTSWPTLTCGMATSQPLLCSAQTNSCKAMSATWPAHYNTWHAFSNSKTW